MKKMSLLCLCALSSAALATPYVSFPITNNSTHPIQLNVVNSHLLHSNGTTCTVGNKTTLNTCVIPSKGMATLTMNIIGSDDNGCQINYPWGAQSYHDCINAVYVKTTIPGLSGYSVLNGFRLADFCLDKECVYAAFTEQLVGSKNYSMQFDHNHYCRINSTNHCTSNPVTYNDQQD